MDELITGLKKRNPSLTAERVEKSYLGREQIEKTFVHHVVSGLPGNGNIEVSLRGQSDLERFEQILESAPLVLQDKAGCKLDEEIHVLLSPTTSRTSFVFRRQREADPIKVETNYFRNNLSITIGLQSEDMLFPFFVERSRQVRRSYRFPVVATIRGLDTPTEAGLDGDVRNILNSVLFDLEFTYGFGFEAANFDSLQPSRTMHVKRTPAIPTGPIQMVYKDYVAELLEYYHAGQKVDYLPFRYICYFHVLEYFSDKSAYHVVAGEIREMLLRPDFHENVTKYVSRAVQIIKKESERNITDKVKLTRVLRQFVTMDEIQALLGELNITDYFSQTRVLECARPLELPALDFSSEGRFFETLTKRIYSLRCSIVHSNPEFDESKAIPFIPTAENLDALRTEILLISEISKNVIIKSARNQ